MSTAQDVQPEADLLQMRTLSDVLSKAMLKCREMPADIHSAEKIAKDSAAAHAGDAASQSLTDSERYWKRKFARAPQ
ncbi:hypothetical protein IMSHALPRED_008319 [Imshaugia aleurites]|uniref:Uncharacterized protein n=1 Tax=Imshaugia aleurites TaxID=172621 RepID=A0A8H3FXL8_9LECA|nr:hypothetical protein IMSHALPRED_008319 [Imshaugia aleurites]